VKTLRTLLAFVKRDFLIEISYRTSFLLQFSHILFSVLIWKFISGVVPPATPGLEGVDYFAFVLVGLAFYSYLTAAMASFSGKIRSEQMTGTLEAMLVTPAPTGAIVLGSSLWEFVMTSVNVIAYLTVGIVWETAFDLALPAGGTGDISPWNGPMSFLAWFVLPSALWPWSMSEFVPGGALVAIALVLHVVIYRTRSGSIFDSQSDPSDAILLPIQQ